MRIEAIKAYLVLLEEKSFTAASEKLFISQSTLSRQIAELEKATGAKLLERNTHSVRITPSGKIFYEYARRISDDWDSMMEKMSTYSAQKAQRICIGYTTSEQLPFILYGVQQEEWLKKGIEVTMRRVHPREILRQLRENLLDCAVMHRPTLQDAADLESLVLTSPRMTAIVPTDSPIACQRSVLLRQLAGYADVRCVHERDPFYYDAIDRGFLLLGCSAPSRIETGESEELPILVRSRGCMSLCPSIYPAWEGTVSVPIRDFKPNFDFLLVTRPQAMTRDLETLASALRKQFS